MREFESAGMALEPRAKRRSPGARFAQFGDRIARSFATLERPKGNPPEWAPTGEAQLADNDQATAQWEELQPPFPLVRQGYEPAAVDQYVVELEQELEQLRADRPAERAIAPPLA